MDGLLTEVLKAGPWAALAVLVLFGVYKLVMTVVARLKEILDQVRADSAAREAQMRAESIQREERLVAVIDKQSAAISGLSTCIDHHALASSSEHKTILTAVQSQ